MKMFKKQPTVINQIAPPKNPVSILPSEAMRQDLSGMISSVKCHLDKLTKDKGRIIRELDSLDARIADAEGALAAMMPAMDSLKAIRPIDNVKAITEAIQPVKEAAE